MEIENYREINEGKLIAKFDLYLGAGSGVTYPNLKVLKTSTGDWYLQRPSYLKKEREDGSKEWGYYPEMDKEKWESLKKEVIPLITPLVKTFKI